MADMVAVLRDLSHDRPWFRRSRDDTQGGQRSGVATLRRQRRPNPWLTQRPAAPQPLPSASPSPGVSPGGDLGQKVPFGFVLGGQTFTSASAWPLFYEALLEELYERAAEKLSRLADEGSGFLRGGKPLFARLPDRLDDPLPVAEALFAEADLSPEDLIEVIKGLLCGDRLSARCLQDPAQGEEPRHGGDPVPRRMTARPAMAGQRPGRITPGDSPVPGVSALTG